MREIEFRAWDKKTKKMREVDSIAFHNKCGCFDSDNNHLPKVVNLWGYDVIKQKNVILHREAKEVVLMQFTGLLDKNGQRIFEGDIVRCVELIGDKINEFVSPIWWASCCFLVEDREDGTQYEIGMFDGTQGRYPLTEIEVIGNIHDDPSMLGGAE